MLRTKPVRAGNTLRHAGGADAEAPRGADRRPARRQRAHRPERRGEGGVGRYHTALHPFPDGNGRMARGLVNMVLARFGCPFVVGFAANEVQRAASRPPSSRATRRRTCGRSRADQGVRRARLGALESAWASKRAAAAQEAAGARQRSARDEVRSSNCIICLDGGPSMTLVCCGGAFHMRCLSVWLASSTTCPQCRAVVPPEERPAAAAERAAQPGGPASRGSTPLQWRSRRHDLHRRHDV